MKQITLYYRIQLLRDWKSGRVHRKWYRRDMATFCERDLSNAEGQYKRGLHFGEWLLARCFLRRGFHVLPEKYLSPTRPRALQKATEVFGKDHVAFLLCERRFGSNMRTSPRPDLLVFKSGLKTFFFVEVKRDNDKLSSEQRQFFPMIEEELSCEVRIVYLQAGRPRRVNVAASESYTPMESETVR
jgi:VRR-NUC domain